MKKIYPDKILNIDDNLFDNKFLFEYFETIKINSDVEVIYISDELKKRKNSELLDNLGSKYAMYSNVYSPKDELEIFSKLFNNALKSKKRIHIIGVTLKEEITMLEEYYNKLGFMREDINCFAVDFNIPLVTVSVKIENLMWKGSDYKAQKKNIFFIPPIRESGQNKAMFKGINRGVISGIYIENLGEKEKEFLNNCIVGEKILSLTLAKVLGFNLSDIGFEGNKKDLVIDY